MEQSVYPAINCWMEPARQRVCFVETLSAMDPCITVVAVVACIIELTEGHSKITLEYFTLNTLLPYPPQIYWACKK